MAVNKRLLVINTLCSYTRTLLTVALSLFTTRWIINSLGAEDFGLYFLVGGLVACIMFINNALAASVQRFLSCSMDRNRAETVRWFTTSFYIHLGCALLVIVLSLPFYFIGFKFLFVIPPERLVTCKIVYWAAIASSFAGIISAPFVAMFTAKQHIFAMTLLQMLNTIALFILAYALLFVSGDRLLFYALTVMTVNLANCAIRIVWCMRSFAEARIGGFALCKGKWRSMLTFSWWNLLDTLMFFVRNQGLQIVFNRYGGKEMNASYSIGNQLAGQTSVLSSAVVDALAPGIMAQYGAGDTRGATNWCIRACKVSTVLSLLIFVPLYLECDYVLKLWLITPPAFASMFMRAIIVSYLVMQTIAGCSILIKAQGNIARLEIFISFAWLAGFGAAILVPLSGLGTSWAIGGIVVSSVLYVFGCLYEARRLTQFRISVWVKQIILPCLVSLALGMGGAYAVNSLLSPSFLRLVLSTVVSAALVAGCAWLIVCDVSERNLVKARLITQLQRLRGLK